MYYALKIFLSALLIVAVAEAGKRSTLLGALLASLPMISLLGMIWLYMDTGDAGRVALLARDILWLVLPSLVLFILFPLLIRSGMGFWISLALSIAATILAYAAMLYTLQRLRGA
jgi:hypothetical protein